MPCSTKYLGKTTQLSDSTGDIGEIKEITPPEISIDELETTTYGAGYWRTFCAGLKNGGSLGVTCFYGTDASSNAAQIRMNARAIGDPSGNCEKYTITFPDGKTMLFSGIIVGMPITAPIDDNMLITYNIKVSGAITGTLFT